VIEALIGQALDGKERMRGIIRATSPGSRTFARTLRVRNWRAGDRFWPAHTKVPKKIKELLQELHVAQPERRLVAGGALAETKLFGCAGFAVPARLRAEGGE
jgi:tRNA(Ile)-lysidine synthetase-like protein